MDLVNNWYEYLTIAFIESMVLYLPAMVSNAAPVLTNVIKKRHPIDCGRNFVDGRRIFGDGKTWEGLIAGLTSGLLIGIPYSAAFCNPYLTFYTTVMGLGALLGDLTNAFVKRRLGLARGAPLPPIDQIDYLLGAYALVKVLSVDSIVEAINLAFSLEHLAIAMLLSLLLHPLTNAVAYITGFKDVPW